jgi:hypothetical protein
VIQALVIIGVICFVVGLIICLASDTDLGTGLGFGLILVALICGGKSSDLRRNTPEYKLWEKHQELEEKKKSSHKYSIERKKQIWIWKRSKQLDDSLIIISNSHGRK